MCQSETDPSTLKLYAELLTFPDDKQGSQAST